VASTPSQGSAIVTQDQLVQRRRLLDEPVLEREVRDGLDRRLVEVRAPGGKVHLVRDLGRDLRVLADHRAHLGLVLRRVLE
jgi:hypothetical protein